MSCSHCLDRSIRSRARIGCILVALAFVIAPVRAPKQGYVGTASAKELASALDVIKVSIEKQDSGFVFVFQTCAPDTSRPSLFRIEVSRLEPNQKPLVSFVRYKLGSGQPQIDRSWRYGTVPPGYSGAQYEPLRRGQRYHLSGFGGGLAQTDFLIDDKGSPVLLGGDPCQH